MQATSREKARVVSGNPAALRNGYQTWFTYDGEEPSFPDLSPWPNDPLGYCLVLPRSAVHYPLGYPVRLATNSSDVLLAAEESWSGSPQFFFEPPLNIRMAVEDGGPAGSATDFRIVGHRNAFSIVSDSRNLAVCDWSKGFCDCRVTAATAGDRPWLRAFFLDTIVNLTLWQTHLTRIHAGCVERNGCGVLLCGDSGAGKSCLTYACARRGWTLISDEAPSILRRTPERIAIGKPHLIHLRETAFPLFPELRGREAKPNPVGKISIEVRTGELGIRTAYRTSVAAVVFLNRNHEGPPALAPIEKEEVWRRFAADLPFFGQPAHDEHKASLRNLLGARTCELRYRDLDSAIDKLEELVGKGERS
jgi:hypothetical protein